MFSSCLSLEYSLQIKREQDLKQCGNLKILSVRSRKMNKTRMTTFINAKVKKTDDHKNIDN